MPQSHVLAVQRSPGAVPASGQTTMEVALYSSAVIVPFHLRHHLPRRRPVGLAQQWSTSPATARATRHPLLVFRQQQRHRLHVRECAGHLEQAQFNQPSENAAITVNYFSIDPDSGTLDPFTCSSGDCTIGCIPDVVQVSIPGLLIH